MSLQASLWFSVPLTKQARTVVDFASCEVAQRLRYDPGHSFLRCLQTIAVCFRANDFSDDVPDN